MASKPTSSRTILHVDMDAFYASVEQRDNPELRGKPVVVGGGSSRGVVAAASYEARAFGIRSAMPMVEARRRCRNLYRVAPRMPHYRDVSRGIFAIFNEFTPLVEGLSLDEAFLDVSSSTRLFGAGRDIARTIKARIFDETELKASVGVAENKLVAKIASDLDKPDGLVVITSKNVESMLGPLPAAVLPGIGKQTLARLHEIDIRTIADLRAASDRRLRPVFGRFTGKTRQRASGVDDRPVVPARAGKSVSAEETYDSDLSDRREMERQLLRLTERTARRLRRAGLVTGTVQLKIRQADFRTFTRQKTLRPAGNGTDQLFEVACDLLATWLDAHPDARIRLLGVGGSRLAAVEQGDLFAGDDPASSRDVDRAVDEIRDRFGSRSVSRARTLGRP